MTICAFFGHADTPITNLLENQLTKVVTDLVLSGTDEFWLCEQGSFDWISRLVLKELKIQFKWISLCLVEAYKPSNQKSLWIDNEGYGLIYPDEVAKVPSKAAIPCRNEYIAKNADIIVCYITHTSSGAYQAVEVAKKYGKTIINLAD